MPAAGRGATSFSPGARSALSGRRGLPAAVDELLHITPARARLVLAHAVATTNEVLCVGVGTLLAALLDCPGLLPVPELLGVDLRFQGACAGDVHSVSFYPVAVVKCQVRRAWPWPKLTDAR